MTDDNSFLRQTLKDLRIAPVKLESQVRSWKKTCGLGPTQRNTVERLLEREIAPVELNGLNEVTSSQKLEQIENGNFNLLRYLQHSGTIESQC